ncbi:UPF0182 family protein [Pilimelia columellifera]|uniref:UPF0182 protein GCM10010201_09660 n=1 Tax=Pilimelia columellifera subsp. columellifera TaxID=706583 RepID=A0ABP6AHH6_9ACTN
MVTPRNPLPRVSRRGRATFIVGTAGFLIFSLISWAVRAYTDWLWFDEVRFTGVFGQVLSTRVALFLAVGAAMALVVGGNLYLAFRLRPLLRPHSEEQATLERYRMIMTPRVRQWIGGLAVAVGLFAGMSAQAHWPQWLLFRNRQPFGVKDPEFGVDVGFYVFAYPFWRYLLGLLFTALVLSLLGALAVHYLYGGVRLQGIGDRMTSAARTHLATLVALFVLGKAAAYFLDRRGLLLGYNEGTNLFGAGYTDINALLPAKEILAYISIVVAIAIIVFSFAGARNLVWPGMALALLGVSAVAIGGVYPAAVQFFTVKPSVQNKEAEFIGRSIEATRAAYGLGAATSTRYSATNQVPRATLGTDRAVVPNARLLDPELVSETYTALQQVRNVYDFGPKLDIDRYTINGQTQDYVVGVREVSDEQLTGAQRQWQNRHTVYTHGYGLVAAPANRVCNGLPFFVSGFLSEQTTAADNPCAEKTDQIKVAQPRVYYGEQLPPYAIVGQTDPDRKVEFDRPLSSREQQPGQDDQVNYTYTGVGGIEVGSLSRRLLYSIALGEGNFLLSNAVNDNSKLLYVREPRERVQKVAPFLTLDGDPYPAVIDGRIQWIVDGYTTAATYPYAQVVDLEAATRDELTGRGSTLALKRQNVNYIRNSVKATVDAYDGTVTLYQFDETDPVLKAWNAAFGGKLIKPRSEIPPALMAHLRYPADLFKVQRNLISRFHVTDPIRFFRESDMWQVPNAPDNPDSNLKQPPYYLLTQLPGQKGARFQLTSAVSPTNRQNLAALISGSYDEAGKPVLETFELPSESVVAGPIQIHQQMISPPEIRRQLSQLTADNKAVVEYGNLLALPIDNGLLYVEPVYVKSTSNRQAYPLLQSVLLSYGDGGKYVTLAPTLEQGIQNLIALGKGQAPPPSAGPDTPAPPSGPTTPAPSAPTGDVATAVAELDRAIAEVKAAQASGDFVRYGRALAALDAAMARYKAAQAAPRPAPTTGG